MFNISKRPMPYSPDVQKLKQAFPNPEPETIIPHEELENVLGLRPGTYRYYGVINSWRTYLLREFNIDTQFLKAVGLEILTAPRRMEVCEQQLRRIVKATRKTEIRLSSLPTDELDEAQKRRYDHEQKLVARLTQESKKIEKMITANLKPVAALPKPPPGN